MSAFDQHFLTGRIKSWMARIASGRAAPDRPRRRSGTWVDRSDPAVITVDEAAALLRVDRKSIYESIRRGELPGVVRVGRAIRISRTALLQWLSGRVSRPGTTR